MSNDQPDQQRRLEIVVAAANEAEAEIICARLAEAGIRAVHEQGGSVETVPLGVLSGPSAGRNIYVEAQDLERAREVLESAEAASAAEAANAGEEDADAGRSVRPRAPETAEPAPKTKLIRPIGTDPRTGRAYEAVEVPVAKRSIWDKLLGRQARSEEEGP
jgi:Putative prokaryotic signal transducing protein